MVTREQQLNEAIKRMEALKLHPNAIADFKNDGKVNVSSYMGALFWANEEQQKMIKEFEEQDNALIYHCIECNTEFGHLFNMLFVSQYEEDWEIDNEDIKSFYPLAMVNNLTDPLCSDMGCIGVKPVFGGLVRTV